MMLQMSNTMKAMFDIVIGLALAGVVFGYIATTNADTNTPATTKVLVTLLGTVFIIGLLFQTAVSFGIIEGGSYGKRVRSRYN